ncbi:hypothetical protein M8J75_007685 [Diaphorina citri]|nr:hypothetical protein M8J75_007685 [Diaphorina citri]
MFIISFLLKYATLLTAVSVLIFALPGEAFILRSKIHPTTQVVNSSIHPVCNPNPNGTTQRVCQMLKSFSNLMNPPKKSRANIPDNNPPSTEFFANMPNSNLGATNSYENLSEISMPETKSYANLPEMNPPATKFYANAPDIDLPTAHSSLTTPANGLETKTFASLSEMILAAMNLSMPPPMLLAPIIFNTSELNLNSLKSNTSSDLNRDALKVNTSIILSTTKYNGINLDGTTINPETKSDLVHFSTIPLDTTTLAMDSLNLTTLKTKKMGFHLFKFRSGANRTESAKENGAKEKGIRKTLLRFPRVLKKNNTKTIKYDVEINLYNREGDKSKEAVKYRNLTTVHTVQLENEASTLKHEFHIKFKYGNKSSTAGENVNSSLVMNNTERDIKIVNNKNRDLNNNTYLKTANDNSTDLNKSVKDIKIANNSNTDVMNNTVKDIKIANVIIDLMNNIMKDIQTAKDNTNVKAANNNITDNKTAKNNKDVSNVTEGIANVENTEKPYKIGDDKEMIEIHEIEAVNPNLTHEKDVFINGSSKTIVTNDSFNDAINAMIRSSQELLRNINMHANMNVTTSGFGALLQLMTLPSILVEGKLKPQTKEPENQDDLLEQLSLKSSKDKETQTKKPENQDDLLEKLGLKTFKDKETQTKKPENQDDLLEKLGLKSSKDKETQTKKPENQDDLLEKLGLKSSKDKETQTKKPENQDDLLEKLGLKTFKDKETQTKKPENQDDLLEKLGLKSSKDKETQTKKPENQDDLLEKLGLKSSKDKETQTKKPENQDDLLEKLGLKTFKDKETQTKKPENQDDLLEKLGLKSSKDKETQTKKPENQDDLLEKLGLKTFKDKETQTKKPENQDDLLEKLGLESSEDKETQTKEPEIQDDLLEKLGLKSSKDKETQTKEPEKSSQDDLLEKLGLKSSKDKETQTKEPEKSSQDDLLEKLGLKSSKDKETQTKEPEKSSQDDLLEKLGLKSSKDKETQTKEPEKSSQDELFEKFLKSFMDENTGNSTIRNKVDVEKVDLKSFKDKNHRNSTFRNKVDLETLDLNDGNSTIRNKVDVEKLDLKSFKDENDGNSTIRNKEVLEKLDLKSFKDENTGNSTIRNKVDLEKLDLKSFKDEYAENSTIRNKEGLSLNVPGYKKINETVGKRESDLTADGKTDKPAGKPSNLDVLNKRSNEGKTNISAIETIPIFYLANNTVAYLGSLNKTTHVVQVKNHLEKLDLKSFKDENAENTTIRNKEGLSLNVPGYEKINETVGKRESDLTADGKTDKPSGKPSNLDVLNKTSNEGKTNISAIETISIFYLANNTVAYLGSLNKTTHVVQVKNQSNSRLSPVQILPDILKRLYHGHKLNENYTDKLQGKDGKGSTKVVQVVRADHVILTTIKSEDEASLNSVAIDATKSAINRKMKEITNERLMDNVQGILTTNLHTYTNFIRAPSTRNVLENVSKRWHSNLTASNGGPAKPTHVHELGNKNISFVNNTSELFSVYFIIKNTKMYLGTVNRTTFNEFLKNAPNSVILNLDVPHTKKSNRTQPKNSTFLRSEVQGSGENVSHSKKLGHNCETHEKLLKEATETNARNLNETVRQIRPMSLLESMARTTLSLRELNEIAKQYPVQLVALNRVQCTVPPVQCHPCNPVTTEMNCMTNCRVNFFNPTSKPLYRYQMKENNLRPFPIMNKNSLNPYVTGSVGTHQQYRTCDEPVKSTVRSNINGYNIRTFNFKTFNRFDAKNEPFGNQLSSFTQNCAYPLSRSRNKSYRSNVQSVNEIYPAYVNQWSFDKNKNYSIFEKQQAPNESSASLMTSSENSQPDQLGSSNDINSLEKNDRTLMDSPEVTTQSPLDNESDRISIESLGNIVNNTTPFEGFNNSTPHVLEKPVIGQLLNVTELEEKIENDIKSNEIINRSLFTDVPPPSSTNIKSLMNHTSSTQILNSERQVFEKYSNGVLLILFTTRAPEINTRNNMKEPSILKLNRTKLNDVGQALVNKSKTFRNRIIPTQQSISNYVVINEFTNQTSKSDAENTMGTIMGLSQTLKQTLNDGKMTNQTIEDEILLMLKDYLINGSITSNNFTINRQTSDDKNDTISNKLNVEYFNLDKISQNLNNDSKNLLNKTDNLDLIDDKLNIIYNLNKSSLNEKSQTIPIPSTKWNTLNDLDNIGLKFDKYFSKNNTRPQNGVNKSKVLEIFRAQMSNGSIYDHLLSNLKINLTFKDEKSKAPRESDQSILKSGQKENINVIEVLDKYCPLQTIKYPYMIFLLSSTPNHTHLIATVDPLKTEYSFGQYIYFTTMQNRIQSENGMKLEENFNSSSVFPIELTDDSTRYNQMLISTTQSSAVTEIDKSPSSSYVMNLLHPPSFDEGDPNNDTTKELVKQSQEFGIVCGDDEISSALEYLCTSTVSQSSPCTVPSTSENVCCPTIKCESSSSQDICHSECTTILPPTKYTTKPITTKPTPSKYTSEAIRKPIPTKCTREAITKPVLTNYASVTITTKPTPTKNATEPITKPFPIKCTIQAITKPIATKYTSETITKPITTKYTSVTITTQLTPTKHATEPITKPIPTKCTIEAITKPIATKYTSEAITKPTATKYASEAITTQLTPTKQATEPITKPIPTKCTIEAITKPIATKYTSEAITKPTPTKYASEAITTKPTPTKYTTEAITTKPVPTKYTTEAITTIPIPTKYTTETITTKTNPTGECTICQSTETCIQYHKECTSSTPQETKCEEFNQPCQTSSQYIKHQDTCDKTTTKVEDHLTSCFTMNTFKTTSKTHDPCQQTTPKTHDPCQQTTSKTHDPCQQTTPKTHDPCQQTTSKTRDPCQQTTSKTHDPCQQTTSKTRDPCQQTTSKTRDPCQQTTSKTHDPCQQTTPKTHDPCQQTTSKTRDPCQQTTSKTHDPCQQTTSKTRDPCQQTTSKTRDPCQQTTSKTHDPCQQTTPKTHDPCQQTTSKTRDPCQQTTSQTHDPCQQTTSKTRDPCQQTTSKTRDPCQQTTSKTRDPCQQTTSKTRDPCQQTTSQTHDPCQQTTPKTHDPCQQTTTTHDLNRCQQTTPTTRDPCQQPNTKPTPTKYTTEAITTRANPNEECTICQSTEICIQYHKECTSSTPQETKCKEFNQPCQTSSQYIKHHDMCDKTTTKVEHHLTSCFTMNTFKTTSKTHDPCQQTTSKTRDPCQQTTSKTHDPCQQTTSKTHDPCQKTTSKTRDPCQQTTTTHDLNKCQQTTPTIHDLNRCQQTPKCYKVHDECLTVEPATYSNEQCRDEHFKCKHENDYCNVQFEEKCTTPVTKSFPSSTHKIPGDISTCPTNKHINLQSVVDKKEVTIGTHITNKPFQCRPECTTLCTPNIPFQCPTECTTPVTLTKSFPSSTHKIPGDISTCPTNKHINLQSVVDKKEVTIGTHITNKPFQCRPECTTLCTPNIPFQCWTECTTPVTLTKSFPSSTHKIPGDISTCPTNKHVNLQSVVDKKKATIGTHMMNEAKTIPSIKAQTMKVHTARSLEVKTLSTQQVSTPNINANLIKSSGSSTVPSNIFHHIDSTDPAAMDFIKKKCSTLYSVTKKDVPIDINMGDTSTCVTAISTTVDISNTPKSTTFPPVCQNGDLKVWPSELQNFLGQLSSTAQTTVSVSKSCFLDGPSSGEIDSQTLESAKPLPMPNGLEEKFFLTNKPGSLEVAEQMPAREDTKVSPQTGEDTKSIPDATKTTTDAVQIGEFIPKARSLECQNIKETIKKDEMGMNKCRSMDDFHVTTTFSFYNNANSPGQSCKTTPPYSCNCQIKCSIHCPTESTTPCTTKRTTKTPIECPIESTCRNTQCPIQCTTKPPIQCTTSCNAQCPIHNPTCSTECPTSCKNLWPINFTLKYTKNDKLSDRMPYILYNKMYYSLYYKIYYSLYNKNSISMSARMFYSLYYKNSIAMSARMYYSLYYKNSIPMSARMYYENSISMSARIYYSLYNKNSIAMSARMYYSLYHKNSIPMSARIYYSLYYKNSIPMSARMYYSLYDNIS